MYVFHLPNEIGGLAPGLQHLGVAQVDLGHGLTAAHIGQLTCGVRLKLGLELGSWLRLSYDIHPHRETDLHNKNYS